MLSSASFQKFLSVTIFTMVGLTLIYLHTYLVAWSRGETQDGFNVKSPAAREHDYHQNAGVLKYVDPKIGTYGVTPNGNGGMIPSVGTPFGMTRWTPQTRENFISQCPYNDMDEYIHGFQATHQPAIWMGESGQVVLSPGVGPSEPLFTNRARKFSKKDERSTPYVYEVIMDAAAVEAGENLTESIYSPVPGGAQPVPDVVREGANGRVRRDDLGSEKLEESVSARASPSKSPVNGKIRVAMTATSHVGRLLVDYSDALSGGWLPTIFVQATRQNWTGQVVIDADRQEVYGRNPQRQDYALGPLPAKNFSGYFVSRFSAPFVATQLYKGAQRRPGLSSKDSSVQLEGDHLGAEITFARSTTQVEVRTGVSFVSIDQARYNLDFEAPKSVPFGQAVEDLKGAWLEKLGRVTIESVNVTSTEHDQRTIWYTGLFHALQYPSDFSEKVKGWKGNLRTFYSGYTDSVHSVEDSYYQSWSIWDTFRAEHSLLAMFAPERVNSMMRSLVRIYEWAGRLPMWANIVETNIMIGTHVDAVIANALTRGFKSFDLTKAWEAVQKNAYEPPINDTELLYFDREGNTPDEVRAGLTTYMEKGYVANDRWAESGSRTLDYAFDDHAAAIVAEHAGDLKAAQDLRKRSMNYRTIYNAKTGFMEAKNDNHTWAGREQGWAEGDDWIYTFSVMHDPLGLAELMGGRENMKAKLDEYFNGGYNDHSNEPSHHAPYLYAAIGYPSTTQTLVRDIASQNYNATSAGLSGNEDLGQMSAWYIFSALGFYPLNPASDEYVVGAPFFEKVAIRLPAGARTGGVGGKEHVLSIVAPGALTKPFVKSVKVDGKALEMPVLKHKDIVTARTIEFEMASEPQAWGHW
ncbi:Putative alpha-1,2-mannosidase, six-hairpin glycosidase superfamily [Septoria linicola]|uniref:Alpha-1,2-mannosidase, six-hairpin glycosidase superfamily n=1 Tax=Septoria linicola TaxID=215465 RepID=A0A9Q9AVU4_9PEZI|nr:putative alpha-1,2-mannosidase, six-hairpin glycosidase superfamily [Septoria linicola]USW53038.1 Putative alpha-1,2-mannosidase, six-hairpin glycosidase superfamily [Septoria linicola]